MSIIYNGTTLTDVVYNGVSLDKVIFNGVTVFEKVSNREPASEEYFNGIFPTYWSYVFTLTTGVYAIWWNGVYIAQTYTTSFSINGYTYYRGTFRYRDSAQRNDFYGIYRIKN